MDFRYSTSSTPKRMGPEDVKAAAKYLDDTIFLYGGGTKSQQQTEEILDAGADAVVVGDCFHENPDQYLQTVPDAPASR
nr:geranylgeranylglyceryl/heptaprenylglyceryl phosphate synthase [Haloferax massiliensis]